MKHATRWIGLAVLAGLLASTQPCQAGAMLYLDRAGFNAATTGDTTFNFDSLSAKNSFTYFGSSVITNGVMFTSSAAGLYAIGRDYSNGAFAFNGANVVLQDNRFPTNLTVSNLGPGVTAFGVDVGVQFRLGFTATITLTLVSGGVESLSINLAERPNLSFVGITSSEAISSVTFRSPDFGLSLADVTRGQALSAVPEPSTLASGSIAALFSLGYAWRRRKAKLAA